MMDVLVNSGIGAIKPEIFLLLSTIFLLLFGLYRASHVRTGFVLLSLLAIGFTGYLVVCPKLASGVFLGGMFTSNAFTIFAKVLILASGGLVLMLSSGFLREEGGRPFEFIILMLFALLGMMLMVSAADLLALYMALEMSSLALYVLASFNRDHAKSSEAGLKYFVLGALASGMMLFGMSLVYGFAGSTSFEALGTLFAGQYIISKGVILGLILIMVGFCFKLSAVPFHMWTPDVYEGAPTPVTAFFATAPKVAALALFIRLLLEPFAHAINQWQQIIIFVSIASMLVGAFGAITQTNIKRLLAYSSIGHVGFMLMALAAGKQSGVQAILIYLSVYIFMSVGMFGCVLLMKRDGKSLENIKDLSGLSQNNPLLAIVVSICVFSMAGIPPMAGFFGKMYVVLAAIEGELTWLAVIGVCTSVVGCYYYLKIIKTMYFDEREAKFDSASAPLVNIAIAVGAGVTMLFFLVPSQLIALAKTAASVLIK
jgi:NADH-quinone oxidoreductase subunit N